MLETYTYVTSHFARHTIFLYCTCYLESKVTVFLNALRFSHKWKLNKVMIQVDYIKVSNLYNNWKYAYVGCDFFLFIINSAAIIPAGQRAILHSADLFIVSY